MPRHAQPPFILSPSWSPTPIPAISTLPVEQLHSATCAEDAGEQCPHLVYLHKYDVRFIAGAMVGIGTSENVHRCNIFLNTFDPTRIYACKILKQRFSSGSILEDLNASTLHCLAFFLQEVKSNQAFGMGTASYLYYLKTEQPSTCVC